MFYFELATGLRRGELFGLKWSDIGFRTGAIRIQRLVQRLDGKVQETKLKTSNSYRTILVDQDILNMLLTMKTERKIESDYVFCSPTGGILEPGSQRKRLQLLLENCGMEKIRFHDLRHSCASMLIAMGWTLKDVQEWLGHADIKMTANIYTDLDTARKSSIAASLEEKFGVSGRRVVDESKESA